MDNYPAGLTDHTPGCPWSEVDVPEKDFEVICSQSLSRTCTVTTNNYIPGASGVDYEPDGEGRYSACRWQDPDDTSDTDWSKEYDECGYKTPLQLIQLFKLFLEEQKSHGVVFRTPGFTDKLIEECDCWTEDETEIFEG